MILNFHIHVYLDGVGNWIVKFVGLGLVEQWSFAKKFDKMFLLTRLFPCPTIDFKSSINNYRTRYLAGMT